MKPNEESLESICSLSLKLKCKARYVNGRCALSKTSAYAACEYQLEAKTINTGSLQVPKQIELSVKQVPEIDKNIEDC